MKAQKKLTQLAALFAASVLAIEAQALPSGLYQGVIINQSQGGAHFPSQASIYPDGQMLITNLLMADSSGRVGLSPIQLTCTASQCHGWLYACFPQPGFKASSNGFEDCGLREVFLSPICTNAQCNEITGSGTAQTFTIDLNTGLADRTKPITGLNILTFTLKKVP